MSSSSTGGRAWDRLLDRLETQLQLQREAVRTGEPPDFLDLKPPDEPLSALQRARAADLMSRTDAFLYQLLDVARTLRPGPSSPYT